MIQRTMLGRDFLMMTGSSYYYQNHLSTLLRQEGDVAGQPWYKNDSAYCVLE